ncbi:MAG: hypothetical protein JWO13_1666 [Acidobacteriales bacterium]|nr:hypothetical protein [Terriglobales bacterium]
MLILIAALPCAASEPIVAIDVSQSMQHYGAWQGDVKAALASVLFDGKKPSETAWRFTGNVDVLHRFLAQGSVRIIRFGSYPVQEYPYFNLAQASDGIAFNKEFPNANEFKDQKTNKPLALAIAADLSAENASEGFAIVVSDFLTDSDVSQQHQDFINKAESEFSQQIPLTLTWLKDPRVQLKFIQFERASTRPNAASQESNPITLLLPEFSKERPVRYVLRWKADNSLERFNVKVEDSTTRETMFEKSNLASREAIFLNPPSRNMRWYVTGWRASGESVRSNTQTLTSPPRESSILPIVLLLTLIAGAGALVFRTQKLPAWIDNLLKRRNSEWS